VEKIGPAAGVLGEITRAGTKIHQEIDCQGACLVPGFVDPHTHMCFARPREAEFGLRLAKEVSRLEIGQTVVVKGGTVLAVEGFEVRPAWGLAGAIGFLVIFSSILAVNALHTLMRRGEATRVTSLLYLTPIIAVLLEWWLFAVVPTPLTTAGVVVACAGVALVAWRPRRI